MALLRKDSLALVFAFGLWSLIEDCSLNQYLDNRIRSGGSFDPPLPIVLF